MKALFLSFNTIEGMYLKLISVDFNSHMNNYNKYLRKLLYHIHAGIIIENLYAHNFSNKGIAFTLEFQTALTYLVRFADTNK
jgi:hypothetical protein